MIPNLVALGMSTSKGRKGAASIELIVSYHHGSIDV